MCCFHGCKRNRDRYPNLHMFQFPTKRHTVCEAWVKNCANEYLDSLSTKTLSRKEVCEKHFEDSCFQSTMKTKLHPWAVPTLLSLEELDTPSSVGGQRMVAQEPTPSRQMEVLSNPMQTPSLTQTQASSLSQDGNRTPGCEVLPRRALFSSPSTSKQIDPSTPQYKKFKSILGRRPTPKRNLTPGKRKLLERLEHSKQLNKKYQRQVKRLSQKKPTITKDMLMQALRSTLPEKVADFVCMQLKHVDRKRMPWTEEEKKQSLAMRYKSPALYEQMRSDGFALPSHSTIARWLNAIDLRPGVCLEIMKMLENKIKHMNDWEKKAVILFDEMSIKSSLDYDSKRDVIEGLLDLGEEGRKPYPATHVLLFMARGLTYGWKMPIAYFATNNSVNGSILAKLITNCIDACQNAGLDVKAIVCDQSSVNRKAALLLETSKEKPYFERDNKRIYLVYDFPHVVKCIRNNLMKQQNGSFVGQISFCKTSIPSPPKESGDGVDEAGSSKESVGVADWGHVKQLYDIDSQATKSRATKLTEKHIKPNSFEKMSVRLSTQVFSLTTSAAMRTAHETGQLPSSALDTATFLEQMNNVFDVMNSKTKFSPNPYNCALSSSTDKHLGKSLDTLLRAINWVKSLKMVHVQQRPPCMESLEHSLEATKLLWQDLQKEGVKYLMTGRINQDPIENEFSIARQKCGFERNPSVRLFRQNLRHRIQSALIKPPAGANCEPDDDELLSTVTATTTVALGPTSSPATASASTSYNSDEQFDCSISASDTEDEVEDEKAPSLESCSVRYFAGYGVRACLKQFDCAECKSEFLMEPSATDTEESLLRNREYRHDNSSLMYPQDETVEVADIALTVLDHVLKKKIDITNLKKTVMLQAKRRIFMKHPYWLKCNSNCYKHREFLLNKLVVAKLKRGLQAMSQNLRQPGGKYGGRWEKIMKITNK